MLTSIALILLLGLLVGYGFKKLKLPSLIGMILVGIVISPYALNLLDENMLLIAKDVRQIALVIILTRAGLSLKVHDLKKIGRPAILMCFVPACLEIVGTMVLAPLFFDVTLVEAMLIGSVIAAVSPAVIVPRMIQLIDSGYGKKHSIPQLVLAGASVDDVFVIIVFTALTTLVETGEFVSTSFIQIPVSIVLGIGLGVLVGWFFIWFFKKFEIRDTIKVIVLISISFLLLEVQTQLESIVLVSGLLAIMSMGMMIKVYDEPLATRLATKYNKLWLGAEVFLFVLVGATVNMQYAVALGLSSVLLVLGTLVFRIVGVWLSLIKTPLTKNEKVFCMISYTPKATVQAAIGAIPLSMGLACGELVLTIAVVSILITAPLGAILIDNLYKKLLSE